MNPMVNPANNANNEGPRPRGRRWKSISLRAFLLLVVLLAFALGWITNRARARRDAVTLVERLGGRVVYDYEWDVGSNILFPENAEPDTPRWLIEALGIDFFHHVTWLRIEGEQFGDEELKAIDPLDRIQTMGIVQTAITNEGVAHVSRRRNVRGLFLGGNHIDDAGIDRLRLEELPMLEVLEIRGTRVSPKKIAEIEARYPNLMLIH